MRARVRVSTEQQILALLRVSGPKRTIDLVRATKLPRRAVCDALGSLSADHWVEPSRPDWWSARTRRERAVVIACIALDAAVDDRPLHALLGAHPDERAAIAALSLAVETAEAATWSDDGNSRIRDADEPRAGT